MSAATDLLSRRTPIELEEAWDTHRDRWLDLLSRLVDQNSFSDNAAGIDAVRCLLARACADEGLAVEEPTCPPSGGAVPRPAHLVARRVVPGAPRVLLIGHLDTVHPPGVGRRRLEREGDVLLGPGVGDIKGGAVAVLGALRLLRDCGLHDCVDVTVFMNSDEEVGSHCSRDLLRSLARGCDAALGFEPAFCPPGEAVEAPGTVQHVIQRKGCGRLEFRLHGVAAHAGGAHHLGASAIEAMARKIVAIHALTDGGRGVTTNVGLVSGGRSPNTVAPEARAEVDFRYASAEDGQSTWRELLAIVTRPERVNPTLERHVTAEIEASGGALWPPMLPTPASRRLSGLVVQLSEALGVKAEGIARGGASDAAHAAAEGVPAICGLGPVAAGIHTDEERTSISGLRRSAIVAAITLSRLPAWKQGLT